MNRLIGRKYITVKGIDAAAELAKTIAENDYQVVFYENEENGDVWTVSWCDTIDGNAFCELTESDQCEVLASRDNVGKADVDDDDANEDSEESEGDSWWYEKSEGEDEDCEEPNEDGPWYEDKDEEDKQ